MDSRRDQPDVGVVGDERKLLSPEGEYGGFLSGANNCLEGEDNIKGWGLVGWLRRRPGVRSPIVLYMLWERECGGIEEGAPEAHPGLFGPVEKLADGGV